ncbi:MAG TPA: hypothetical protein VNC22_23015 [Sporichthya sp.]|nr:hypothetical protein [Sporichthya sp.]
MARRTSLGCDKEIEKALIKLVKLGCTWRLDGSGHILITTPDGDHYSWTATPPNPGITVKKARMIERRLRAGSRRPTPTKSSPRSDS